MGNRVPAELNVGTTVNNHSTKSPFSKLYLHSTERRICILQPIEPILWYFGMILFHYYIAKGIPESVILLQDLERHRRQIFCMTRQLPSILIGGGKIIQV